MNVYPYCQNQQLMFPPSIKDKLPDDHDAVIINDIIEGLELDRLYRKIPLEGRPSYHPLMMIKVLIYAYIVGVFSSMKISRALYESIPFIYLAGWQTPDFRTISDFRKNNLEEFKSLFKQVVDICKGLGMVKLGHVAIDGTKIKASAADERTYDEKKIEREIERLINEAKAADEKEDALYGATASGTDIPADIRKREDRIKKLRQLKEKLAESGKDKINATDSDASFMKGRSGIKTSFNAQTAVDEQCNIIIANDVVTEACDVGQLENMVDQAIENTGKPMDSLSADAGYSSGENLKSLEDRHIDAYIPDGDYQASLRKGKDAQDNPFHKEKFTYNEQDDTYTCPAGKQLHFSYCQKRKGKKPLRLYQCSACEGCPHREQCTRNRKGRTIARLPHENKLKAMREKLDSPQGKAIYAKRQKVVEPVFGIIKNVMGFRAFSLRGLQKVRGEFNIVSIAYNIKKITSFLRSQGKSASFMIKAMKYQMA